MRPLGIFFVAAVVAFVAAVAWGQTIQPSAQTGGGETSTGGGMILSGIILDAGVGTGTGVTSGGGSKVADGFFPTTGPIVTRNVADPAWLKISRSDRTRNIEMATWREPESDLHTSINLTGWQL